MKSRALSNLLLAITLWPWLPALAQNNSAANPPGGPETQAIDQSANPCQDFFQYACGNWIKNHPIPADEGSWGRFDELFERNQIALREILEDAAQHQDRSPVDQKIGGFYQSCMNEEVIEQRGTAPLDPELERISRLSTPAELADEVARLQMMQVDALFSFSAPPDPKNAKMTIAQVDQGGLGLPERDYYFRADSRSEEIRKKYVEHVTKMFELIKVPRPEAEKKAAVVMSIETGLAKASLDITSRRDPQRLVHEMSKAELLKLGPKFDFNRFFAELKTPEFSKVNVAVPDYVTEVSNLISSRGMSDLKDYLAWHYVHGSARVLPKAFVTETFNFYSATLAGVKEQKPRWKRCVSATDAELGEALGRKFVEKTFGEEGKDRTLQMVREIERQMAKDIDSITWMTNQTKTEALAKLHAIANKIGYPEKWRDYSTVLVTNNDYFANWYRANQFEAKRQLDKIGKVVDRSEWEMTPPTVNAYYSPPENNINFPAGILQPPFYSNSRGDALNYGAIGLVIGHELTHGFDDQGRQFDGDGNLKDWWQKSDAEKFEQLADCFIKEYSAFEAAPGVHENGKLTLGENTADNGGARLAYFALMADLAQRNIPTGAKTDGFTQPQLFFLGFAQAWCESIRPEAARESAQLDPHSLARFRVNGVVSNMPEFSQAFGCKAGDAMYAGEGKGCRVW